MVTSMVCCEVRSVPMTSTSGTRKGGFHQWVPTVRAPSATPSMMLVMGITEVLLARIAWAGA